MARVDVQTNGIISHSGGTTNNAWIPLDSIVFFKSGYEGSSLPLHNGWVNYGHGYQGAVYKKSSDNLVVVVGLIKYGAWSHLATLPAGYRPAHRIIFNLNNHQNSMRIDVTDTGLIYWQAGGQEHNWISLSGIVFYAAN